jgi:hypothetical protein
VPEEQWLQRSNAVNPYTPGDSSFFFAYGDSGRSPKTGSAPFRRQLSLFTTFVVYYLYGGKDPGHWPNGAVKSHQVGCRNFQVENSLPYTSTILDETPEVLEKV